MASSLTWASKVVPKRKQRIGVFENGLASQLPEAYRKFWKEWKESARSPVHYVHEQGRWKKNEVTGEIFPVQNVPIPTKYPKESHWGIWGGEGVIKGFLKRKSTVRRIPHYWIPQLKRSVVYSEILNVHLSLIITDRTLTLIHDHYGFDHYLLKTPACDLKSRLAIKLKRQILTNLQDKCPVYINEPEKQNDVYETYKHYLSSYTPEEIEWYGLSFGQAMVKLLIMRREEKAANTKPLKHQLRSELIQKLQDAQISGGGPLLTEKSSSTSWMAKINPFSKKET